MRYWTLIVFASLFPACRQTEGYQPGQSRQATGDTIKIGVTWPFSTKKDLFKEGVALAIQDINADGGVLGFKLEAVYQDDGGKVTTGKTVAQGFAEDRDIIAVIGHYDSFIAIPASVTYAYYGLIFISPGATNPKLTSQGFSKVFRTIPSDTQIGSQLAELAYDQGYRRTAIIYEQSNYGRQLANAIEFRAEDLDILITDRLSYDPAVEDYRLMFNKLRLLEFDAVFFAGFGSDAQRILDEAQRQQFQFPFLGGNGLDTTLLFEGDPSAVENTLVLSVFHLDDPNPYVQSFIRHFNEAYGGRPDAWAAQGFDAVHLFAHAIRSAQSTAPEDVADALRRTANWYGVTGSHSFDENGEIQGKPMVKKIAQNGELEFFLP